VDGPAHELAVRAALLDDYLTAAAAALRPGPAAAAPVKAADRGVLDVVALEGAALGKKRCREHDGHEARRHTGDGAAEPRRPGPGEHSSLIGTGGGHLYHSRAKIERCAESFGASDQQSTPRLKVMSSWAVCVKKVS